MLPPLNLIVGAAHRPTVDLGAFDVGPTVEAVLPTGDLADALSHAGQDEFFLDGAEFVGALEGDVGGDGDVGLGGFAGLAVH